MTCGLTRAKYRRTITSLRLLTTVSLVKARLSWPPEHTAGSYSANYPPISPGPFPLGSCPATLPTALHGVVMPQVQDPALGLVELHAVGLSPWVQQSTRQKSPHQHLLSHGLTAALAASWLHAVVRYVHLIRVIMEQC